MSQPKTAPISIRLPEAITEEVDAWAQRFGHNRHKAIVTLIVRGLRAADQALSLPVGPPPSTPGSRLNKR